jgi:aminoglycoside phosphotransferase (APT) family kinase protein
VCSGVDLDGDGLTESCAAGERDLVTDTSPGSAYLWYGDNLALQVTGVTPILSGFSKETVLVDLDADGVPMPVVIRRDIPYGAVTTTVVEEYPVVAALHRYGLPVPEPVLLETDATEFGEAFTVTKRASGAAATNAMSGLVAGPELTAAAYALAAFLGRLHSINLADLGLPHAFYDSALTTHDYLMREIDICERYYRNHRQQPSPTIVAALTWLRANVPQVEGPPRLVHGDASLSNVMMDGNTFSIMLDWELSHPGDAVEDVTYTRKWIDQFMPWDDFLAHYYQHGGPQYHPQRERFYAMLSDLRVALFAVRTQDMLNKGDHPEITHMYAAQHYYGYFVGNVAKGLLAS